MRQERISYGGGGYSSNMKEGGVSGEAVKAEAKVEGGIVEIGSLYFKAV